MTANRVSVMAALFFYRTFLTFGAYVTLPSSFRESGRIAGWNKAR